MKSFFVRCPGWWWAVCMLSVILVSCSRQSASDSLSSPTSPAGNLMAHATHLSMYDFHGATCCVVRNPWQPGQVLQRYILVHRDDTLWTQHHLDEATQLFGPASVVRTPLHRVTLGSCCHAYLLCELGALDHIRVLCEAEYAASDLLCQALDDGRILNGGNAAHPNTEVILQSRSEALWVSPFEKAGVGHLERLHLPLVMCADYMETTPLGRAEWMKFYGRLVGKTAVADSLFHVVESRYRRLSHNAHADTLPALTLLAEIPTGATWYVPGGRSYMGRLFADAGFLYPWEQDTHSGSLALSPEAVLQRAMHSDIWLFKYYSRSGDWDLATFCRQHPLLSSFRAAQTGQVYGCNTARSDDFNPFRPDRLLQSLQALSSSSSQQSDSVPVIFHRLYAP